MNSCNNCSDEIDIKKLIENIPSDEDLKSISDIFKALSEPLRIKILFLLKDGELCVCHINSSLNKPQSTISHHLSLLKNINLLNSRKEGKWTYYSLKNPKIIPYIEKII
ncbi:ArsR/SmtB family transcription factor [Methanobrevibacter sp. DSM 116169]|uniref:ArsR/SmtB family transcription factor n=1 Tax=Methanobrevibacter sp. DSM 116169 TaxID=3242727 RepID=UPI0038FCD021